MKNLMSVEEYTDEALKAVQATIAADRAEIERLKDEARDEVKWLKEDHARRWLAREIEHNTIVEKQVAVIAQAKTALIGNMACNPLNKPIQQEAFTDGKAALAAIAALEVT